VGILDAWRGIGPADAVNGATSLQAAVDALQPPPPTRATRCYGLHLVRGVNGNETQFTTLFFNNGDLENPAVIERITIRDVSG
jgi:hypothetical protein